MDETPTEDQRHQAWREIMGNDPPEALSDLYLQFTSDLFVNVWARPGLSRRDRRLITLTAVATRGSPEALPHPALQLDDLSPEELSEWVVHLAYYAGWPASAEACIALQTALSQTDSP